MYSCECYDYSNQHIYKHIHAVHMPITQTPPCTVETECEWQICPLSYQQRQALTQVTIIKIKLHNYLYVTHTDPWAQLWETQRLLGEPSTIINEENTVVHPYLKSINANLKTLQITKASSSSAQVKPYSVNDNIAPSKKNDTQPKFYATVENLAEIERWTFSSK